MRNFTDFDHVDYWRKHYERQSMEFMARLMQHFNVNQITLDMTNPLPVGTEVEVTPELGCCRTQYRLKGHFELADKGAG